MDITRTSGPRRPRSSFVSLHPRLWPRPLQQIDPPWVSAFRPAQWSKLSADSRSTLISKQADISTCSPMESARCSVIGHRLTGHRPSGPTVGRNTSPNLPAPFPCPFGALSSPCVHPLPVRAAPSRPVVRCPAASVARCPLPDARSAPPRSHSPFPTPGWLGKLQKAIDLP